MKNLSVKWQKLIIWLTGYVNIIAFFLAGGYLYLKTENEEIKNSAKTAFFVTACCTGLELLRTVIYYIMVVSGATYSVTSSMNIFLYVIYIVKALAFLTLFILDMVGIQLTRTKKAEKQVIVDEKIEETQD